MVKMPDEGVTIIISGPSGVGKSAIIAALADRGRCFRFVTPVTTRTIRSDEIDGHDYEFISKLEFQTLIANNKLYEWDYILNNYYGFRINAFIRERDKVNITHALARMALRIKAKRQSVITLFLEPNDDLIVRDRLANRGEQEEIHERIRHGIDEKAHISLFDYVIQGIDTIDFVTELMEVIQHNKSFNSDWLSRCATTGAV